jgi:hypothetical protein
VVKIATFSGSIVISIFDPSGATNCIILLCTDDSPCLFFGGLLPMSQFFNDLTGEAGFDSFSVVVAGGVVGWGTAGVSGLSAIIGCCFFCFTFLFFFSLSLFSCFLSVGVYVAGSLVFVFADEVVLPVSFLELITSHCTGRGLTGG